MHLEEFLAHVTSSDFLEFCVRHTGLAAESIHGRVRDYVGEVEIGARLMNGIPLAGRRVLEVGAGLGLLGAWLKTRGAAVVLLEPGAGGFDDNLRLLRAALEWLDVTDTEVLAIRAEELDPEKHGVFDVIFSVNVLEHIPQLESAFNGMLRVLARDGLMRHTCPNYAVPYEPHYGIPLVPMVPAATGRLVPSIARQEVWRSLNFITYDRVERFCRQNRLECDFDKGLAADAFARMDRDPAFRARQGPLIRSAQRVLAWTGGIPVLAGLPPRWATPMSFTCRRNG
jgi:2-polyprenyl-3-methyl-5-hydroxy-6-metoxy-1,4-benzoquinol methylase